MTQAPDTSSATALDRLLGLPGLATIVDQDTFIYIVRTLYRIVFKAARLKETKVQLHARIRRFEIDAKLPGVLSALPIATLLQQLEDAQYLYPVRRDEITLPTFA